MMTMYDVKPHYLIDTKYKQAVFEWFYLIKNGNIHYAFLTQSVNTQARLGPSISCSYRTTGCRALKFGTRCLH